MQIKFQHKILTYFIASVWFLNGLYCKVLNLVPRHQQIVSTILGNEWGHLLTIAIGISEILMAIWVISGILKRLNVLTQVFIIAIMNVIEFILVPDLLLWGRLNIVFAFAFITLILYNEFVLNRKSA
jgi:uncharacterized membrane protein YphA (DoxX/SURF4 family)